MDAFRVYIATLRKDEPSPFPALSDEAEVKEAKKDEATPTPVPPSAKKPTKKAPKPKPSKSGGICVLVICVG